MTLRRSSTTPQGAPAQPNSQIETATTSDIAPAQSRQYGDPDNVALDSRYSKDKLLDIYRAHSQHSEPSNDGVSRLFVNNWEPGHSNGSNGRGWGKGPDSRDHNNGPDICWDQSGQVQPVGLEEMTAVERAVSFDLGQISHKLLTFASFSLWMLILP